jgi:hypothetical protein
MQLIDGQTLARVIEELRQIGSQGADVPPPGKDLAFALKSRTASASAPRSLAA